ncbi:MAG: DUF1810 domain-containing protein [Chthoniobacterales bacterium]
MRGDSFNLERFVEAQERVYAQALSELKSGRKRSHWMWFVFPQVAGLGSSAMSQRYAISDAEEARAYLDHPVLGSRLRECCETLLWLEGRSAVEIFGATDELKLRSSATLFASVVPNGQVFQQVLDRYFEGEADEKTIERLEG